MEPKDLKSNERMMQLSIHYYVLSLSKRTSRLYEGFRDTLIDIQNTGFPFEAPTQETGNGHYKLLSKPEKLREFLQETDEHFAKYFAQDPLWMVLIGERKKMSIFKSLSAHNDTMLGEVVGDYSDVDAEDLGKIVWPVVKQILAGANARALNELQTAAETNRIVVGFDAVGQSVRTTDSSSLFVEEDYHVTGSIRETEDGLVVSPHVDVSEVIDDAVDLIVEKVLAKGGHVVFLESDSMTEYQQIALILHDA